MGVGIIIDLFFRVLPNKPTLSPYKNILLRTATPGPFRRISTKSRKGERYNDIDVLKRIQIWSQDVFVTFERWLTHFVFLHNINGLCILEGENGGVFWVEKILNESVPLLFCGHII